jgi:hypothetical protein
MVNGLSWVEAPSDSTTRGPSLAVAKRKRYSSSIDQESRAAAIRGILEGKEMNRRLRPPALAIVPNPVGLIGRPVVA